VTTDPFAHGALTDIEGIRVGHHQRTGRGWQTGTTVVFAPDGVVSAVDVRGGGPGTRETDALRPGNLVDRVHAICLSGGSAYGLSAADGVMQRLEGLGLGVPVGPEPEHVVPVVPTAVIFDLGRGGAFRNRPDPSFGERALRSARPSGIWRGSVGAGTGARAGGLQGGLGMASTVVDVAGVDVRVAALAVVNAAGTVIDPAAGRPWFPITGLRQPTSKERRDLVAAVEDAAPSLNTTIGVIATDADLDRPELGRLAIAAHDGLARAIRPAHSLMDGDTIFGLAVPRHQLPPTSSGLVRSGESRAAALNSIAAAAADVFATACVDAVVTAARVGEAATYRDLCPSAYRPLSG
jgi:L-aminopeptidase/D-esterase-like protein